VRRYKSTYVSETDFLSLISVIKGYDDGDETDLRNVGWFEKPDGAVTSRRLY
jgi:hypothetical protein